MFVYLLMALFMATPLYFAYKPPKIMIRYFQRRWPDVLFRVCTDSKLIALTIDDSPSRYTSEIMEILDANDSNATFFVIGSQIPGFEKVLENLLRSEHELGNHAMHDEPSRTLTAAELAHQISSVENILTEVYKEVGKTKPPKCFRPGSGFFNDTIRATVKQLGYGLILGSVYPHDPYIASPAINTWHILSMIYPGDIIICHDRRSWTPGLLRKVIPEIRRKGFRLVTITELLQQKGVAA